jgi:hypothetical protein
MTCTGTRNNGTKESNTVIVHYFEIGIIVYLALLSLIFMCRRCKECPNQSTTLSTGETMPWLWFGEL